MHIHLEIVDTKIVCLYLEYGSVNALKLLFDFNLHKKGAILSLLITLIAPSNQWITFLLLYNLLRKQTLRIFIHFNNSFGVFEIYTETTFLTASF